MANSPIDRSQVDSILAYTARDGDNAQAMPEIHEGKRLEQLLQANRYEKKQLADAAGVTKQAVQLWVKRPQFPPAVWAKVVTGLEVLRLSPLEIRPEKVTLETPFEDLTRLVDNWPRVQLSVLKRILESSDTARRLLLAYVNGALRGNE